MLRVAISRPITNSLAGLCLVGLVALASHADSAPSASSPLDAFSSEPFPAPFEAQFEVFTGGTKVALTVWRLTHRGKNQFVYESRTESKGFISLFRKDSIVERSEGFIVENRAQPLSYAYDRHRGDRRRQVRVGFDWDTLTAANTLKGQTWKMAIPEGTLDKLSYLLMMMQDLRLGKRVFSYEIADGGTLKTYKLELMDAKPTETPLGTFNAVGLRRLRHQSKRETVFWCAEQFGFLPVKISHREPDGNALELVLMKVKGP